MWAWIETIFGYYGIPLRFGRPLSNMWAWIETTRKIKKPKKQLVAHCLTCGRGLKRPSRAARLRTLPGRPLSNMWAWIETKS